MSRPKLLFLMVYDAAVVVGGTAVALVIGLVYLLPQSLWDAAVRKTNGRIQWVAWIFLAVIAVLLVHSMGIDFMLETLRKLFDHDCRPNSVCL